MMVWNREETKSDLAHVGEPQLPGFSDPRDLNKVVTRFAATLGTAAR